MARGATRIAGVDEAGRGPLAGPVVAAAVVLDPARIPEGLNDSKMLSAARRARLLDRLREVAQIGVGLASVAEIDALNILRASHLAMERALASLPCPPDLALIDGNMIPRGLTLTAEALGQGRRAVIVDRRRLGRGQGDARPDHGGFGATPPRLWLGEQRRIPLARPQGGADQPRCDPSP